MFPIVNCSPLLNSKRCFKASIQNCKIEALKLVGKAKQIINALPYGKFTHRC
ncbi:hypothetical protein HMPREF9554_03185 [Treponema phagedenis F0421]|nr:hypothetical protein HMPREF9554_03185 [Treponema phagedenis F0421]